MIPEALLQQLTTYSTTENGLVLAFAIGIPLAVLGYLSFLKSESKGKNYNESRSKSGSKVKKYTPDGKPVSD